MSRLPSVMKHSFSQVPAANIPRSQFNRSHGYKTTLDAGKLIPIYVDEVLPGDTFNLRAWMFGRLQTPTVPYMDNLFLDVQYFFVPNRLVWSNWQKFNGEQEDPGDSTDYLLPQMTSTSVTGYGEMSIFDYFGLPTKVPGFAHCALPLRAYNLVWNEWYRDENLQDSVVVNKGNGPDSPTDYGLLFRGKRHDYFTSALPWPQKGPAVPIPAGTVAVEARYGIGQSALLRNQASGALLASSPSLQTGAAGDIENSSGTSAVLDPAGTLIVDLADDATATINALRTAFQIQKLYERDARGGTRYTEIIRAHFGVISPDARLQRPEYLGGGSSIINVQPVAQTSESGSETPQGNLAAFATVSNDGGGFVKSFTEHGYIIGLASMRADLRYQQGLDRAWSRRTRWDYYWPALSNIGEQAILNKEIYTQGSVNPTQDAAVFGYQERYAEYRYKTSQITGQFRSNSTAPLDMWHLAQDFSNLPVLDEEFINENPPVDRIIAVPSEPQLLLDCYFKLKCARPMPVYSVPGLVDHF